MGDSLSYLDNLLIHGCTFLSQVNKHHVTLLFLKKLYFPIFYKRAIKKLSHKFPLFGYLIKSKYYASYTSTALHRKITDHGRRFFQNL